MKQYILSTGETQGNNYGKSGNLHICCGGSNLLPFRFCAVRISDREDEGNRHPSAWQLQHRSDQCDPCTGQRLGTPLFACDFLKGCLPVFLLSLFFCKDAVTLKYLPVLCALFAVLGHIFPVWLKFKGGKGIAVAAGAIFALAPLTLVCGLIVWAVTFFASRYVSLASIFAAASLPFFCFIYSCVFDWEVGGFSQVRLILLIVLAVLAILKHTSNIKRLLNGTENRFEKKKKAE